jgi:predicted SnoaL-like aldol condensation-catalyzing enzyme
MTSFKHSAPAAAAHLVPGEVDLQMAKSDIEKVLTVFHGIGARDADLATRYMNPEKYKQHNPYAVDGVAGLREYISQFPRENHYLKVTRAFQDEPYVFTQEEGLILGQSVFFDIFRFEDGLIVEHWVFSAKAAPPNESGHTQTDGPMQAKLSEDKEKNKSIMREYYETVHISGDHGKIPQYFSGDHCIRHEPGVRDGVAAFIRDVDAATQHRSIDEIKFVLGQGDFVFVAAKGSLQGDPCVYIDLYRVEGEKLAEHWGFPEKIPPQEEWKNRNGML